MDKIKRVRDALLSVMPNVGHYTAQKKKAPYIVWAEDGEGDAVWADGKQQEQTITGTIDYFTETEFDPTDDRIQAALSEAGVSFRINLIQYEEDTKLIHTEWVWWLG